MTTHLRCVLLGVLLLAGCSAAPNIVSPTPIVTGSTANIPPTLVPTIQIVPTQIPPTIPPTTTTVPTFAPSPTATAIPLSYQFVWKLSTQQAPFNNAGAGATDAQGNIYLLNLSDQVVVIDPNGQVLRVFGEHGAGKGQLNFSENISTPLYPDDVVQGGDVAAAPNGNIYVAEGANHRVSAFDANGKFLFSFGKRGQADGEFEVPWAIATDRESNVYVGDFTGTMQKFDANGKFLARFGKGRGAGKGQFVGAVFDVETDAQGNIYAADRKSGRIEKFDAVGNFVTQWDVCANSILDLRGLAVDANGNVYVSTRGGHRVCIFDSNGKLTTTFGKEGLRDGEFIFGDASADLAVAPDGSLYVVDTAGERIQKFKRIP